jgi:signal transduction histidine kinase
MVWDEPRQKLVVRVAHGFRPETLSKMSFAPGEGAVGQVALSGEPVIVEDVQADPQVATRITEPEGIRSFIHVPIKIKDQVFGVFNIDYLQPRVFGEEEVRLFKSLAQRAALAIENAQLYEQAQELAAVEERQRLARDLHDAVTQTLFSASLIAEVLPEMWAINPEKGQDLLKEVRQLSQGALAEMRTLLLELRPAALAEAKLGDLIQQLATSLFGRTGLPVEVDIRGDCNPPVAVKIATYRIAQEALNNIVKHAEANKVSINLNCYTTSDADSQDVIELTVMDDGCGFDPQDVPPDHFGLGIMQERAAAINATLDIESRLEEGTKVKFVWQTSNQ